MTGRSPPPSRYLLSSVSSISAVSEDGTTKTVLPRSVTHEEEEEKGVAKVDASAILPYLVVVSGTRDRVKEG